MACHVSTSVLNSYFETIDLKYDIFFRSLSRWVSSVLGLATDHEFYIRSTTNYKHNIFLQNSSYIGYELHTRILFEQFYCSIRLLVNHISLHISRLVFTILIFNTIFISFYLVFHCKLIGLFYNRKEMCEHNPSKLGYSF